MSLGCTASTLGGFVSARQAAGGELEAMADEERDRRVGLGFDEVGGDMATLRWDGVTPVCGLAAFDFWDCLVFVGFETA
jgi:hypothetical protein